MSDYLFIESRDPGDTFGDDAFSGWLAGLTGLGHTATVFLTQNAVIAARKGCIYNDGLEALQAAGVRLLVDGFYATEKSVDDYADGIEAAEMDQVVDLVMTAGVKTIWH